jgi:hypothetical protein
MIGKYDGRRTDGWCLVPYSDRKWADKPRVLVEVEANMAENEAQGITRRDLLKRGAALGGAVVWATPVVQTLGMGRAFAQTASPVGGKGISYIGINAYNCAEGGDYFAKWEDGDWEESPGAAPDCADKDSLPDGVDGMTHGISVTLLSDSCAQVTLTEDCTYDIWVKGGSSQSTDEPCNKYIGLSPGTYTVCTAS